MPGQDEEEVTFLKSVKKVKTDELGDTFTNGNTILIESILVYYHLIKVSPELALELSSLHTLPYVSNHLKKLSPKLAEDLATLPNNFTKKQDKTKPTNKKTGNTPKRFTPLEDASIKAAVKEAGECGVDYEALAKMLNRQKKSVMHRIETLERTGGVIENLQFTLVEDSMLLENLVIPQSRSLKLSEIVLLNHQCSNLAKDSAKPQEQWCADGLTGSSHGCCSTTPAPSTSGWRGCWQTTSPTPTPTSPVLTGPRWPKELNLLDTQKSVCVICTSGKVRRQG